MYFIGFGIDFYFWCGVVVDYVVFVQIVYVFYGYYWFVEFELFIDVGIEGCL